jgi:hypothetical protein
MPDGIDKSITYKLSSLKSGVQWRETRSAGRAGGDLMSARRAGRRYTRIESGVLSQRRAKLLAAAPILRRQALFGEPMLKDLAGLTEIFGWFIDSKRDDGSY